MNRTLSLQHIRPEITIDNSRESLDLEGFQNVTLRPILKFQNEILLALVNQHLDQKVTQLPVEKQLEDLIKKNTAFKQQLIGLTIGLFTVEELGFYLQHQQALNKRITQLILKRVGDQIN
ncbi:MAG: glyoxalase [Bacteroidota bacterium]